MDTQGHVCLGTCHAFISEKDYQNGLVACGTEGCSHKDKPFVEGVKCSQCGMTYPKGENHDHPQNK